MTSLQPRRPKATWIPGRAQRYESLWILFHKFLLLNHPTREDITEIFGLNFAPTRNVSFGPQSGSFSRKKFASIVGEKVGKIHYSTLNVFRGNTALFFENGVRFCAVCLSHGYHTYLFNLKGLIRCPIHDALLVQSCQRCNLPFSTRLSDHVILSPGECSCGSVFLEKGFFKLEPLPVKKLQVFDPLVRWLESCWNKTEFTHIHTNKKEEWFKEFLLHLKCWESNNLISVPSLIRPLLLKLEGDELFKIRKTLLTKKVLQRRPDYERPYTCIYKSIRRQIAKTYLKNRVKEYWNFKPDLVQHADVVKIVNTRQRFFAFALLIWRKNLENWRSVSSYPEPHADRFFYQRTRSYEKRIWYGPEIPRSRSGRLWSAKFIPVTPEEANWINFSFFAEDLYGFWKQTLNKVKEWTLSGEKNFDCYIEAPLISQSTIRDETGRLVFIVRCADNTQHCTLKARPAIEKMERKRNFEISMKTKWTIIVDMIKTAPMVLAYSLDKGWEVVPACIPSLQDERNYKRRRLLIAGLKRHFILFCFADQYVARCLEFPLQTVGLTTKEVIIMLKEAVKQHSRS